MALIHFEKSQRKQVSTFRIKLTCKFIYLGTETVLHDAAFEGHLEICKLIVSEVDNKNPLDNQGRTPLHFAAMHGHSEIYKFIAERVDEKNPVDNQGKTPLHEAIDNGHLHICRILLDILGIENPTLTEPEAKRLLKE